jgi:hypothetical protein
VSVAAGPDRPPRRSSLRELFAIERPPPQPPTVRRLRLLIAVTAVATVALDLVNLGLAEEAGGALAVRTIWALLRALGFLALMRTVRYGRMVSRPFGLILAVTTVFAVARLVVPRAGGLVPQWPVIAGFVVLAVLCGAVLWLLFRSPVVDAHLTRRPPRRPVPPWVLTTRIAALSLSALSLVPCLVAVASLAGDRRVELAVGLPVVVAWLVFSLLLGFVVPAVAIFVVLGKRWARRMLGGTAVLVLLVVPALCLWLLGVDGLVRDGVPLIVAAVLALYGLWRSRHQPRGVRRADRAVDRMP